VPLIVSSVLRRGWSFRGDVSSVCVYVDKKYLSQQYELTAFLNVYWVHGSIVDVVKVYGPLTSSEREVFEKHVIGKDVKLYLVPGFSQLTIRCTSTTILGVYCEMQACSPTTTRLSSSS